MGERTSVQADEGVDEAGETWYKSCTINIPGGWDQETKQWIHLVT